MDTTPEPVSRRTFATCAAAAAAGFVLTACGPKRLYDVPRDRLRQLVRDMEREYSETYGQAVTVSDAGPQPGVLFGYALDISVSKIPDLVTRDQPSISSWRPSAAASGTTSSLPVVRRASRSLWACPASDNA